MLSLSCCECYIDNVTHSMVLQALPLFADAESCTASHEWTQVSTVGNENTSRLQHYCQVHKREMHSDQPEVP